ncbi:MAG: hypothetical protein IPM29_00995 [Planctomycetes bacterium]|nr:hypothetical protein [Planctomycetota bacterium]
MKMAPPNPLRGLALASACLLFACSGPRQTTEDAQRATDALVADAQTADAPAGDPVRIDPVRIDAVSGERAPAMQDPGSQDPGTQDPGTQDPGRAVQDLQQRQQVDRQRREFLIEDGLRNARRALQLRLWPKALQEAGQVLLLDSTNDEARSIVIAASEQLGDETATVTRTFDNKVLEAQISLERDRFRAQQLAQEGDALAGLGRWGEAIESFERALLVLTNNPLAAPGSELERELRARLENAQQARQRAMQEAEQAELAMSRAEREEAERRRRQEREQRVSRLLLQANRDFQLGNFRSSVSLLEQALLLDPNNPTALALHDLASRALHDNRIDVARQRWKEEWTETFQDLESGLLMQSDVIVYDLDRWAEVSQRQPLAFTPPEDLDSPEDRAVLAALDATVVDHVFSAPTPLADWAAYYSRITDVNFFVADSARELDEERTTLDGLRLGTMSVKKALNVIQAATGVKWTVRNGVVELVSSETPTGRPYLYPYEVRDIVLGVRNRPGPKLKLTVPGEDLDDFGFDEDEPLATIVDDGRLQDLIRNNIMPALWDEGLATMSYNSGALMVRAPKEVHQEIERLLADLRRAIGIQVDIEARFLRVEDSFLEDIGVDFRGLGDQSSEGTAGRGLERNNRSNLRFDDFGRPEQINTASPGEIGTGTEPGIFFDDGQDGDLMARTENLYDTPLGGGEGELDNAGGLSVQIAFLDDTELEVILRAVSKQERSEEIVAPRLLVYNNTRAHMQALRHTSYIRDFDVEIAQAAAVANPIVDVVNDGVVLDVRPIVSADRRFITMELRPTVMNLSLPIPTFTTTLGSGQPVSIQLPNVTLQSVRTTVTMPDGGTILLGGMKMAERQNQVSGVPILKDLPLLSFLFSRKGTYVLNRKVIILIRARIVMSEEFEPAMLVDDYENLLLGK